ncbi:MAG TPA: fasciclin domain-containing protein [Sphingomicrobium sp.]|nr:fasciclin domain-containing protein [Sphingomicrobium sp.]
MKTRAFAFAFALASTALLGLSACNQGSGNAGDADSPKTQTAAAEKAAGDKTIASGLASNGKFMAAAKAAGLDQTLAGPGPYTVFVPDDAAIGSAPAGAFDATPANRAQLTGIITNMILPGTVLAADIGKAIDNGKGKATLATMGGGTVTATKDGDKIVIADAAGHKATVTQPDDQFSNGVVHHVDGLLMPGKDQAAKPAVGQKAG